jgi:hypothetical protein
VSGPPPEPAPLPPADLARRAPGEVQVAPGETLHRFYSAAFEPIFYDTSQRGRLNAPDGRYGVLYAAREPEGAFAETFLRNPGRTQIPTDLLQAKAYVRLRVLRPLTLVKLAGNGLARVGATAEVVHGGLPYDAPQAWSSALFDHPSGYDGIAYNARHDDERLCYALFERGPPAAEELDREADLDQNWFWELAEPYGVGLPP